MTEHDEQDEGIEDLDVDEEAAEDVTGGRSPRAPADPSPVPIPYPN